MIRQKSAGLQFFQFTNITGSGLFHGVFSREGGISPEPWASLNLGGTVGDEKHNVKENLNRLLSVTGFGQDQLVQVRQIHSSRVIRSDQPVDAVEDGDAMTTDRQGLLLLMRFADCVPILFFDPVKRAIAIAHAGWKGTINGVAAEVVKTMAVQYGTAPEDLQVGIGPSIGPDHYQIGEDVIHQAKEVFQKDHQQVLVNTPDGVKLDLWKSNEIHLRRHGVKQIEIAGICTGCDTALWYSHRAEKGRTGRFAAVIGLR